MASIVTGIEQMRMVMPNIMTDGFGQFPMIEKLTPFIDKAEEWICENLLGEVLFKAAAEASSRDIENPLEESSGCDMAEIAGAIETEIECDAWINAIPALDIIVHDTGGMTVHDDETHKVASKERVERVIKSLTKLRDKCRLMILNFLYYRKADDEITKEWESNTIFVDNLNNPFKDFQGLMKAGLREGESPSWERFVGTCEEIENALDHIKFHTLGLWVIDGMLEEIRCNRVASHSLIYSRLRDWCRDFIRDNTMGCRSQEQRLVEGIKYLIESGDNSEWLAKFEDSPIARRNADPKVFRNEKKSSGYFF